MKQRFRPEAESRKIHSRDEFELCYLRHQYFRRTTRNPTKEEMAPYQKTIRAVASNNFFTYKNLFKAVGFDVEDLISIGQVQLVSYLGLFAVESSDERTHAFDEVFKRRNSVFPAKEDILNRDLANFTLFLKQRMEDVVRVCRQKARNVKGMVTDEYHVFYGPQKPGRDLSTILARYSRLGYKKLDLASFRTIRKKSGEKNSVFKYDGNWYICIPIRHKALTLDDLDGADMNPRDALHNMTPEEIVMRAEETQEFEAKKAEFDACSAAERRALLQDFIRRNRANLKFAEELSAAKKMLLTLEK